MILCLKGTSTKVEALTPSSSGVQRAPRLCLPTNCTSTPPTSSLGAKTAPSSRRSWSSGQGTYRASTASKDYCSVDAGRVSQDDIGIYVRFAVRDRQTAVVVIGESVKMRTSARLASSSAAIVSCFATFQIAEIDHIARTFTLAHAIDHHHLLQIFFVIKTVHIVFQ